MSEKFGTVLDENVLFEARQFCRKEHTTISRLLEEAIREYLERRKHHGNLSALEASFGALKLPPATLRAVLEEDIYETF